MDGLKLSIFSPQRYLLEDEVVEEVILPSTEGQIQILPDHISMMGILEIGIFSYRRRGVLESGFLSAGFFEVDCNSVRLMVETLEFASEIDLSRAQKAYQKAQAMLQNASLDEVQFKKYQFKLQRALIRQQVVRK
jgi:F-type H+-transporting ATPase subunit epsilon